MFSKPKSNEIKKTSDSSTNEIVDADLIEKNYNIEKNIVKDSDNYPPSLLSTDLFHAVYHSNSLRKLKGHYIKMYREIKKYRTHYCRKLQ